MTTTSEDLQDLVVKALAAPNATAAGPNVYAPRDWPTKFDAKPILLVQSPRERKDSLGPNVPQFDVHATIRIVGRLTLKQEASDGGSPKALAALAILQRQVEVAVINNFDLMQVISEIETVEITSEVKSEGQGPVAEFNMDLTMKFYQGWEDFAQPVLSVFEQLAVYEDLVNVYDPTGDHVPPFAYPVTPSPRTHGPDGRAEGKVLIELPQS